MKHSDFNLCVTKSLPLLFLGTVTQTNCDILEETLTCIDRTEPVQHTGPITHKLPRSVHPYIQRMPTPHNYELSIAISKQNSLLSLFQRLKTPRTRSESIARAQLAHLD